jgi:hypothetical protein
MGAPRFQCAFLRRSLVGGLWFEQNAPGKSFFVGQQQS